MTDETDTAGVGLADAIKKVRAELEKAIEDGACSPVAFRAGTVEMEFEVAFTRTRGLNGGIQISVISFGAKAEKSNAATNRVKVSLTPVNRDGTDILIDDTGTR